MAFISQIIPSIYTGIGGSFPDFIASSIISIVSWALPRPNSGIKTLPSLSIVFLIISNKLFSDSLLGGRISFLPP